MTKFTRRQTLQTAVGLAALPLLGSAKTRARVVIIGGGFGGATAASYLRHFDKTLSITLIEPKKTYMACPLSNLVIGGLRDMEAQTFNYENMSRIKVIHDYARDIDPVKKTVSVESGQLFNYDYLIMSPGIDMRWNAVEGYDEIAADVMPHAWTGGSQTLLLKRQLAAMADGGTVIISAPSGPYRCPPGPYERASIVAHYLKTYKPKSKVIVYDAKDSFSKQDLFRAAWAEHYGNMIEWRGRSDDGAVIGVDAESGEIRTDFETHFADVANIIPPQKAAMIAQHAGLTDASGWCPINGENFESQLQKDIYVIGDAAIANPMPKSAFSAGLQGKLVALHIARSIAGLTPQPTVLTNTCYSFVAPESAVSITGVYGNSTGILSPIAGAGGTSLIEGSNDIRQAESEQALAWFSNAVREAFG